MENQQIVSYKKTNALSHFQGMNKLGTTFFILFIVGSFLPLADLGGWSNETLSLYNLANPMVLLIIAAIGVLVNLTGFSRTASRWVSLVFVALVVGWFLTQLYDIYDLAKSAREIRGRDFEFKHFVRSIKGMVQGLPINSADDLISLASILLTVAFVGISGCVFSPRYKENKQLKAAITGQPIDESQDEVTNIQAKLESNKKPSLVNSVKAFVVSVITKAIGAIKYIYQIIKPLVNALLDKAADIICQQQPNLKREQVKVAVFSVSVVLLYLLIF
ncbi:hypothetical protein [Colwellia psychrerythraea]|uniref:Uncharacterized protein n=1 Tax=Colwellia psychrerythraea (strain 34H / ATCC BAA-681) TaxID=167879 RepID=Q484H8_COLP3|nr:hypothetical protein [Colwellia psychrerythraea]AAZ24132.1 hypothetical protein CPS_1806 [Colwellia psychrerythraea 34H]